MKKVSIFLASSEELREERIMFGDFINGLRRTFKRQGFDLELVKWEDLDSAFNGGSKEEEYIEELKKCQLFVALFHTVAGQYTLQELEAARKSLAAHNVPSIFIFLKDLKEGETAAPELDDVKKHILMDWKHFNDKYNHLDTLKLRFLQQLILKLSDSSLKLDVENSMIKFGEAPVASLDNVPFAANNEKYLKLKQDIADANKNITAYEQVLAMGSNPIIEDLMNKEKKKRAELNETLAQYEEDLLDMAQRVAKMKTEAMNERTRKAMELFESGDNKGTDALLSIKEIEKDMEWVADDVEKAQNNAKNVISQLCLKAKNTITLYENSNRLDEADEAYSKAVGFARKTNLGGQEVIDLLCEYHGFLYDYALYAKAMKIGEEWLKLTQYVYGEEHSETATAYNNIGNVYDSIGDDHKALFFYRKALKIQKKILGNEHPDIAGLYNNLGLVYDTLGDYNKALESYRKALEIYKKFQEKNNSGTATLYNNIGNVYYSLGYYDEALNFYKKAHVIFMKVLGNEHPDTATSYNNIGFVYKRYGIYDKALDYHEKALKIYKKIYGEEHPYTAISYNNIGTDYDIRGDYNNALKFFKKALEIREKVLEKEHPYTLATLYNIGISYEKAGRLKEAQSYMKRAADLGDGDAAQWLQDK